MSKTIGHKYGAPSVLVNSAGISHSALLLTMDTAAAADVVSTNLFGTIQMSRGMAKWMLRKQSGCIINMSSVLGIRGVEGSTIYSASKAGVIGFTKSLAKELGPRGIRVCAIAPGFIETDMTANLPPETRSKYISHTPLGRFGTAEEVAETAVFLAHSRYITGHTLVIDGGFSI
ncbi:hypothetical protein HDU83_002535 [Entophlyctis luteolus]|nr:hypothetical protein HDU83_002535 [Entophlyctis luteolus]